MVDESVRLISSVMYMNVVVPNYRLFRMFAIQLLHFYNFFVLFGFSKPRVQGGVENES